MRTSCFDSDFALQMKLTKPPLIHCFASPSQKKAIFKMAFTMGVTISKKIPSLLTGHYTCVQYGMMLLKPTRHILTIPSSGFFVSEFNTKEGIKDGGNPLNSQN